MQTRKRTLEQVMEAFSSQSEETNKRLDETNKLLSTLIVQNKKICSLLSSIAEILDSVDESAVEIQGFLEKSNGGAPFPAAPAAQQQELQHQEESNIQEDSNYKLSEPYPQEQLDAFVA